MMNLENVFNESVQNNDCFFQALDLVRLNAKGKIWLIGGFLYRSLASKLYDLPSPDCDLDFIVEEPAIIYLSNGWVGTVNKYGNPKLNRENVSVDYVPLNTVQSIIKRDLSPTIENYLTGTPLTIQSIAYDVKERRIIGEQGIKSLLDRVVAINNVEQALIYSQRKNKSIDLILKEKADSLKFTVRDKLEV
ncbi:hypothetical protein COV11_02830 [Candidatus Woesearchaeota archaeon CG10_big_fil_rev_8_21_14_0_10_30_7]|nr:MAG: hypothetical protein COV11_02830 [Candidatus Woesearchaeota archaeon CG10_big_fil_rev_8_21_14_0_10_30_7]